MHMKKAHFISAALSLAWSAGLLAPPVATAATKAEPNAPTVTVTKKDCDQMVSYTQPPGVAYEPGIDVHGRAVAPADLNQPLMIKPPEEFSFALDYSLAGKVPGAAGKAYEPHFNLGTITVKNGVPYFNGEPLTSEDQRRLSEACQKIQTTPKR